MDLSHNWPNGAAGGVPWRDLIEAYLEPEGVETEVRLYRSAGAGLLRPGLPVRPSPAVRPGRFAAGLGPGLVAGSGPILGFA